MPASGILCSVLFPYVKKPCRRTKGDSETDNKNDEGWDYQKELGESGTLFYPYHEEPRGHPIKFKAANLKPIKGNTFLHNT